MDCTVETAAAYLTAIPHDVTHTQDGGHDRRARRAVVGAAFLWSLHYAGLQGQHRSGMNMSVPVGSLADQ